MPSAEHETFVAMVRDRPPFAVELLMKAVGMEEVPAHESVRLESTDLTEAVPVERRADVVVALVHDGVPVLALVVEVQRGRDGDKRWTWPEYVTAVRSRLRCPTELLVLAPDPSVAAWCARPIELGPGGSAIVPLVVGPGSVPVVADPEEAARSPEMAVLSVLAHGAGPRSDEVLAALGPALVMLDAKRAYLYLDLVHAALPEAALRRLEALMSTEIGEELGSLSRYLMSQGEKKGRAEGEARAVLMVLSARSIAVPDDRRAEILGCADLDVLEGWIARAATATSVEDLFVGAGDP